MIHNTLVYSHPAFLPQPPITRDAGTWAAPAVPVGAAFQSTSRISQVFARSVQACAIRNGLRDETAIR